MTVNCPPNQQQVFSPTECICQEINSQKSQKSIQIRQKFWVYWCFIDSTAHSYICSSPEPHGAWNWVVSVRDFKYVRLVIIINLLWHFYQPGKRRHKEIWYSDGFMEYRRTCQKPNTAIASSYPAVAKLLQVPQSSLSYPQIWLLQEMEFCIIYNNLV